MGGVDEMTHPAPLKKEMVFPSDSIKPWIENRLKIKHPKQSVLVEEVWSAAQWLKDRMSQSSPGPQSMYERGVFILIDQAFGACRPSEEQRCKKCGHPLSWSVKGCHAKKEVKS